MDDRSAPGILEALWRYRATSAAIVLFVVLLSVVATFVLKGESTAKAEMALATPAQDNVIGVTINSEAAFVRYVKQRAIYATSDRVLQQAAKLLKDTSAADLRTNVTATASDSGEAIVVTATAYGAAQAVRVANAVVQAYQDETKQDVAAATDSALAAVAATRAKVVEQLAAVPRTPADRAGQSSAAAALSKLDVEANNIRLTSSLFGSGVSFVSPATTDAATGGGLPLREAAVGLALGLLLAGALAWLRADRDRRARSAEDAGAIIGAPLLGEVPEVPRTEAVTLDHVANMPSESYQLVASGLQATMGGGVLMITGATRAEGRTTTALHLAAAAARDGARVLIVDGDLRVQRLSELFGLAREGRGLAALASQHATVDECTYSVDLGGDSTLWLMPAGGSYGNTPSLFSSAAMAKALVEMRTKYDLVIVDSSPLVSSPDAAAMARHCGAALVVTRRGTTLGPLRRLVQQLDLYSVTVVGHVFTFSATARPTRRAAAPQP
ncbi:polysaccharide biosynthesis tyrosine autokinase [Fodinicola acaciae]|uniref:polysaccharide biosynthesis tyrosine autokinase n=1 Tax=Fodinicola acaciae TaxID=2681555 RepID=UPI0013D300D6|nr:CpsD/CapB family tyrosine-protein kinase [Fodinicola acaciae]